MKTTRFQFIGAILTALAGCKHSEAIVVDDQAQWMDRASGHLDRVASNYMKARLAVAPAMQAKFYGFSCCERCGFPWPLVPSHSTWFSVTKNGGRGASPLCEDCWQDLGIGEFRLPYYEASWKRNHVKWPQPSDRADLELIRKAVMEEKSAEGHSILLMPGEPK